VKRQLILSLDGLSLSDFDALTTLLPSTRNRIKQAGWRHLESNPLFGAQSIWAELLTGERWFKNGCAGYSRPRSSLNDLTIFTEKDLQSPPKLLRSSSKQTPDVVINVPILQPDPHSRVWFADGSLPTHTTISPRILTDDANFKAYKPRPFADFSQALRSVRDPINDCLDVEEKRTACATALLKKFDWQTFIWRVTLFDHLAHLVGLDVVKQEKLFFFEQLKRWLADLDGLLSTLIEDPELSFCIISSFSHTQSKRTLNLNMVLEKLGMLKVIEASVHPDDGRKTRTSAVLSLAREEKLTSSATSSLEGQIDLQNSIAASPVAGSIFINRRDQFADGTVDSQSLQTVKQTVHDELKTALHAEFGDSLTIELNPSTTLSKIATPDMLVNIAGIEFNNIKPSHGSPDAHGRTTHCSDGFVVGGDPSDNKTIFPTDLIAMLDRS
jgi:predicted AlkP superfamily phosphohydrolase/phosphomutase